MEQRVIQALRSGFVRTKRGEVPINQHYVKSLKKSVKRKPNDMCCDVNFCKNPLIPEARRPVRERMPQLGTRRLQRKADSILPCTYEDKLVPVNKLLFSQKEINRELVEGIAFSMKRKMERAGTRSSKVFQSKKDAPIVVFESPSGKYTVGDGHHRTAALKTFIKKKALPRDTEVNAHVYKINPELGLLILNSTGFNQRPETFSGKA